MMLPKQQRPPDNAFRFLLDDPAIYGAVWETEPGIWIACIDWGLDLIPNAHCTDFTLPQPTRELAAGDVREAYRLNYCERTD